MRDYCTPWLGQECLIVLTEKPPLADSCALEGPAFNLNRMRSWLKMKATRWSTSSDMLNYWTGSRKTYITNLHIWNNIVTKDGLLTLRTQGSAVYRKYGRRTHGKEHRPALDFKLRRRELRNLVGFKTTWTWSPATKTSKHWRVIHKVTFQLGRALRVSTFALRMTIRLEPRVLTWKWWADGQ